jgi:hypothetical protein
MLRCEALLRTDVSEERIASLIVFLRSVLLLLATVVPSSPIIAILMMEAMRSSDTWVLTMAKRRNIPGDGILHRHRPEYFKSYIVLTGSAL